MDDALKNLRGALTLLEPYVHNRLIPAQNGGVGRNSARYAGDIAAAKTCIDNALGEIDYTMLDNAYNQINTAISYVATFGQA